MLAEWPDLRTGIDLDEDRGCAEEEDAEVGHAQVHQEDVRAVPHVLAAEHD